LEALKQETLAAWRYLKQKDVINTHGSDAPTGPASVNHKGIDTIEDAKRHPDKPTAGFGSVTYNTIHIHHMEGGAIAQAGAQSTQHQTITYNSKDLDELRRAIEILEQRIDELKLDAAAKSEALVQVDTINAQLRSVKPNSTVIREAGKSLRNVTEGAIGALLVEGVKHWQLVHAALMVITS